MIVDKTRKNFFVLEQFLSGIMVEDEWKENFGMSHISFFNLASLLCPYIEHQVTNMRTLVSVETQVAVTLYYLSDEGRLREVANDFGLSMYTCSIIIRGVSSAITFHLGHRFIELPLTEESMKENVF